jgi:hypothetical protein
VTGGFFPVGRGLLNQPVPRPDSDDLPRGWLAGVFSGALHDFARRVNCGGDKVRKGRREG